MPASPERVGSPSPARENTPGGGGGGGRRSRSASPEKARPVADLANPLYIKAMEKLKIAAFKFNKERNGIWLGTIENRELDPDMFRTSLRSAMNLVLSAEEFETLMPHWFNNGCVNGCDFILLFYRLRFEYRSALLTKRIAKEKAYREKDAEYMEARRKEIESKVVTTISYVFSEAEKESALGKVRIAAWKYDKQGNGAANLDAFDCEYLTPENFKEVLRRTFNLSFTPAELGAFLSIVSDNEEHHTVNCAKFLIYFLRLGLEERNKKLRSQWAERKRINDAAAALEKERLEEQEAKNKQKVATFTEEDKMAALAKLRVAAKAYDPVSGMSMKSFEVAYMAPHEFKEQLKRVFNLRLNAPEMGAVISIFDESGTGNIPCADFAKTFLAMGFTERANRDKINIVRQREAEAARIAEEEAKLIAQASKLAISVKAESFTEQDKQNAMSKMTDAAMWFEKGAPGAPNMEAFNAKSMPPFIFKEQLRRTFNLHLTSEELSALMELFDPEKTGEVVCVDFMQRFLRVGFEEREAKAKRWREMQRRDQERAKKEAEEKQHKMDSKMLLSVGAYSQADFDHAMHKLTHAAIKYHKSPSDVLDAFVADSLPPHVFKEQLKLAFNVKVNMPELGALMSFFDKEGKGSVNSKHFLNTFLRMGYEERDKIREGWRSEDRKKADELAEQMQAKEEVKELKQLAEVEFEFTEEDFDEALMKFIRVCHSFEQRQLGPAGWQAFNCNAFTPAEFREVFKRTFNVRLAPRELGALVTYFQIAVPKTIKDRKVNSQYFLQCFVQGRTTTEGFKGRPHEQENIEKYHEKLKVEYRARKEKMGGNADDLRPWRMNVSMKKNAKGVMSMVAARPYPADPLEKISRRLVVGKDSGRVDLSTRISWPETSDPSAGMVEKRAPSPLNKKSGKGKGKGTASQQAAPADDANNLAAKRARAQKQAHEAAMVALNGADYIRQRAEFRLLSVPAELFTWPSMTQLWLCNNKLGLIPVQLGNLKNLQVLSLCNNDLTSLPPEVCLLPNLQRLILKKNLLTELPGIFHRLQELTELDISKNQFAAFPEVVCKCVALQSVRAGYNPIKTVPRELQQLRSLSFLGLEQTEIPTPPEVFAHMPWTDVSGIVLPVSERSSYRFKITPEDEAELEGLMRTKGRGRQRREARLRSVKVF